MNEKIYRVLFFVTLVFTLLFAGASFYTAYKYNRKQCELVECRAELEQLRTELANADDRQRELTGKLKQCSLIVRDTKEILEQSISTLQGLREQIRIIRTNYEAMETCLRNYRSDNSAGNNSTGSSDSE